MGRVFIFRLFIIIVVLLLSNIGAFGQQLITHDAVLPGDNWYNPCIAIGALQDSIIRAIWIQYTPEWDFYLHLGERDYFGNWDSRQVPVTNFGHASLFLGNDGRAFINSGNYQLIIEDGDDFIVRDIYPNTVMDSLGCFHHIQGGDGFFTYSFSTDTLQSYLYRDTLLLSYDLLSIEASADRGKICAIFSNGDTLFKFTGSAGIPLAFDSSSAYPVDNEYDGYSHNDIGLDKSGKIFIPYIGEGHGQYWASIHVWSEEFGDRFIWNADDPAQSGYRFQCCFAGNTDTVFVLGSVEINNASYILFSTDGGAIWNYSFLAPRGAICTSPRMSGEFLHVISEDLWSGGVYYEAISVEAILGNSTAVNIRNPVVPSAYSFFNYPNPFNSSTTISFSLQVAGDVRLAIYDITGRLVKALVNENISAGTHTAVWDGQNSAGQAVSSGVYFYKLSSEGYTVTRRMLLLK